jgi:uncharacterized protein YqeY
MRLWREENKTMLIDDIKKANIQAMKDHDQNKRSAYCQIISRYLELKTNGSGKEVTDADVLSIIGKLDKELDEEKDGYLKAGRTSSAAEIDLQKAALVPFIPKQMSEEEIKKVIATLEDKTLPSIMKYFKINYAGKVDMGLVSKIARGL